MSMLTTLRSMLTPARPLPAAVPARVSAEPAVPAAPAAAREAAEPRAAFFERLYRLHADRIYGLCLRMSGDAGQATELAQDVFVRAWEQLDRLRPDSEPGAWLWRLAVNVVLNARRADRRRLARVTPVEEPAHFERADLRTPLPVRRLSLDAAIARLPERARAVYVLHDVEGYAHDEVVAMLGIAEGTARAHLHRARTLMREALR